MAGPLTAEKSGHLVDEKECARVIAILKGFRESALMTYDM